MIEMSIGYSIVIRINILYSNRVVHIHVPIDMFVFSSCQTFSHSYYSYWLFSVTISCIDYTYLLFLCRI